MSAKDGGNAPVCPYCGRPLPLVGYEIEALGLKGTRPGPCGCGAARRAAEEEAAEREAEKELAKRRRLESRMRKAGIPPRYWDAGPVPDRFETGETGCWLHGPNGAGKTHIAAMVAIEAVRTGATVEFASLRRIHGEMNDAYAEDRPARAVMMRYARAGLLVLDDLGKETFTPAQVRVLFEIVDWRWSHRLQTVVTSNFDPNRLLGRVASVDRSTALAIGARLGGMERYEVDGRVMKRAAAEPAGRAARERRPA